MEAKGAALMLPFANTRAMQMHLAEISCNVAAKAHGVVLMDRAGWHSTDKLKVPKNLTIILLPSRSPELNPVENIWQYLRQNWLSNRVFEDYDAIIEAGCQAWNKLMNQPETIMSIGSRESGPTKVDNSRRWYKAGATVSQSRSVPPSAGVAEGRLRYCARGQAPVVSERIDHESRGEQRCKIGNHGLNNYRLSSNESPIAENPVHEAEWALSEQIGLSHLARSLSV